MQPHETITAAIRRDAADGAALVPFITAGYPTLAAFTEALEAIATHASVIEIGVPFSDPMADGMTIQRSSQVAIENGVSLRWILDTLAPLRARIDTPVVLMSYLNPLLAYGLERLAVDARAAGVCGFIVPDLPYEESAPVRDALAAEGLGLVQLVTPATPPERLALLANASRGFVYAVTVTGITGGNAALPADTQAYLQRVADVAELPVCAGFGIRSREDVVRICEAVDGAIVGSALVEVMQRGGDAGSFVAALRGR